MKDNIKLILYLLFVAIIVTGVVLLFIHNFKNCLSVGHDVLYCATK